MLTFPSHCSHRLQPLDINVFGPFKSALRNSFQDWLNVNPGKRISIHEVAELTRNTYLSSFTPENIISGFKNSGISLFNRDIFSASLFLPSFVTDRPIELLTTDLTNLPSPVVSLTIDELDPPFLAAPLPIILEAQATPVRNGSNGISSPIVYPIDLQPFPRVGTISSVGVRKRTQGRTRILTSTPEKNAIEDAVNRRTHKPPARRLGGKQKQIRINDENIFPQEEDDFNMDIDPLYRPDYIAPATTITRSGRRSKANPRLDV